MDIPMNADVSCTDGSCGKSIMVIYNPTTQEITHIVMKEKHHPYTERLVSEKLIESTTPDSIQLSCSKDELGKMDEFIEHEFVRTERSYKRYTPSLVMMWPYAYPSDDYYIDIKHERIPTGELAIQRGEQVQALDGRVGTVDEFLIDPDNGHATHIILREGHLWGEKDVSIPLTQVDHISDGTVYLALDKSSIEALPAIPIKRWF